MNHTEQGYVEVTPQMEKDIVLLQERITELGEWLSLALPPCRQTVNALTRLEECELWSIAGLMKHGKEYEEWKEQNDDEDA